ncbi:MAG: hypothetical protein LBI28_09820 [Treponema sp.]|jgi:hypothetical protein|nr:hypothetical protein [Treponema sp.]
MKRIYLTCAVILIFTSCSPKKNNVATGYEDYYFGMTINQIYEKQPFLRIVDEINVDDDYIDLGINGNQFYAMTQFLYDEELVPEIKHPAIALQKNITVYLGDRWPGFFIQNSKLIGIGFAREGEVLQELINVYGEGFLYGEQIVWNDSGRLIVWLKMESNPIEMVFYFDEQWVRDISNEIMKKHREARSP